MLGGIQRCLLIIRLVFFENLGRMFCICSLKTTCFYILVASAIFLTFPGPLPHPDVIFPLEHCYFIILISPVFEFSTLFSNENSIILFIQNRFVDKEQHCVLRKNFKVINWYILLQLLWNNFALYTYKLLRSELKKLEV